MNVKLTEAQKIKVLNADDLYAIMQQVLRRERKIDRNKEHFWVVCLANNNRILLIELVSLGTVNATLVDPMEVFSFALQKRAVQLILVHNHPSQELVPSEADKELTDRMRAIGRFIKLPVIDHLIISEESFYSFAGSGLLGKMERENRYDLSFGEADRLKAELKTIEKKKATEMANRMLEDGQSIDLIVKYTGLTQKQVERLQKKKG